MLRTALALASRGLHVFPVQPRGKTPLTSNGWKAATVDFDTIEAWWRHQPDANIGLATGRISGVFAVDIDGGEAETLLRELEQKHGPLPETVETITPRPGRHAFFKMPPDDRVVVRCSAGKLGEGLDIRSCGGYVIVPPSVGASGRAYAWSCDCAGAFADAPDWLLALIAEPTRAAKGTAAIAAPASTWRDILGRDLGEGARDVTLTRLAGHLLRRRIDPYAVLDLLLAWNANRCKPPLSDADVERIVASIAGKEMKRRGYE